MVVWRVIRGFFKGLWRGLSIFNKAIMTLVPLVVTLYLVVVVAVAFNQVAPEPVPERAALLINPNGVLVENPSPLEPLEALMQDGGGEVLVFRVKKAIKEAAADDRITALILDLEALNGPSISHVQELKAAIEIFKSAGKPVIATGDYYSQSQYLLASQATQVLLHPEGGIEVSGFAVYRNYVRKLLDNVYLTMNVFRVGESKSAVEPYLRDDMSGLEREVVGQWLGDVWRSYTQLVEAPRQMDAGFVDQFINEFPDRLEISGGDAAALMLEAGFVDELVTHSQRDEMLADWVGATDEDGDWISVSVADYLAAREAEKEIEETKPRIAVIPIEGELIPGESGRGFAGSDTVVSQLERALEQPDLRAIVLRINSPGGSVFASEVIRQKILEIKAADLPVVASMGAVAASGGYYIAADADEILAQPSTITGSIGVFAAFPTVEKLYQWAGVTSDGVSTSSLATAARIDTGVSDTGRRIINSMISKVYDDFVTLVALGRGKTWEEINSVAGGRVWSGEDALSVGLVDNLGGLQAALDSAAGLAEIEDFDTFYIGTPISPEQRFFEQIGKELGQVKLPGGSVLDRLSQQLAPFIRLSDSLQDPANMYLRCLECGGF
jgi:protease-4